MVVLAAGSPAQPGSAESSWGGSSAARLGCHPAHAPSRRCGCGDCSSYWHHVRYRHSGTCGHSSQSSRSGTAAEQASPPDRRAPGHLRRLRFLRGRPAPPGRYASHNGPSHPGQAPIGQRGQEHRRRPAPRAASRIRADTPTRPRNAFCANTTCHQRSTVPHHNDLTQAPAGASWAAGALTTSDRGHGPVTISGYQALAPHRGRWACDNSNRHRGRDSGGDVLGP
jgi:hypothetical protein